MTAETASAHGSQAPRKERDLPGPPTARQQRRFDRMLRLLGRIERLLPRPLRNFPFNLWLTDMRPRRRFRRPLV